MLQPDGHLKDMHYKMGEKPVLKIFFFLVAIVLSLPSNEQTAGYAKSNDVNIYYRIYGQGTPIVLLSGGPGFSSNALLPLVDSLKDKYRLILVDQRGTGKSVLEKIDSTTITLEKYVEDVNNVRKVLGIKEWIVLGHSWGGGLAMGVAAKYPDATSKLILVCSIGMDLDYLKYANDNLRYSKADLDNLRYWSDSAVIAKNAERAAYERYRSIIPSRVYNDSSVGKVMASFTPEYNSGRIYALMLQNLQRIHYDVKSPLSRFYRPTILIEGRQDFLGGWNAFTTYKAIPGCQIEFIEKCGHFPLNEQPEKFLTIINRFLVK